jgi:hypothetical protein
VWFFVVVVFICLNFEKLKWQNKKNKKFKKIKIFISRKTRFTCVSFQRNEIILKPEAEPI